MTQIIGTIIPHLPSYLGVTSLDQFIGQMSSAVGENLGDSILNLVKALLFLIVGWIIAIIAKAITRGILNKTDIDNRIAGWIAGGQGGESIPIEDWISEVVFWLIFLFAVVASLNALELETVSQPLNSLLDQVTSFLPQIAGAGVLLAIAWAIATAVKFVITGVLRGLRLDERLGEQVGSEQGNQLALSETIANALYWFIFLLFLPSILSTLQLEGTLQPVQELLDNVLGILPNIFAAVLIGAIGWLIAQVVRRIVTNLLVATGVDQIGTKFGLSTGANRQSLSQILGTIVYVLVLIPTTIAALDKLQIQAISEPATAMLNQVLDILPKIFAASVILILAYIVGQYISELVTNILRSIGFNNIFEWLGISAPQISVTSGEDEAGSPSVPTRTPSELVGTIVLIAIILVAALTAVDILEIEALTTVVQVILVLAGQVLVALVFFAIGLYLSNIAYNLLASSGNRQSKILGQTARIAIITLVSAMALERIGIATNIVNLAFGLLLGGIAVAIALAFGLGGRDVAGEQIRAWLDSLKQE